MMVGFAIASGLIVVLAIVHSVLGHRFIIGRLRPGSLPPLFGDDTFTRRTLAFVWHALTIVWIGIAVLLVIVPPQAQAIVGWTVAAVLALTAILTIAISRGRHLSWIVELAAIIALLPHLL